MSSFGLGVCGFSLRGTGQSQARRLRGVCSGKERLLADGWGAGVLPSAGSKTCPEKLQDGADFAQDGADFALWFALVWFSLSLPLLPHL